MKDPIGFGYLPEEYCVQEESEITIVPVAYDGTSTWIKGADKGPQAIIEASSNMELYDIDTDSEVYKRGIFTETAIEGDISTIEMVEAVEETVRYHLEDHKFAVVIGGEHSVSIGSFRAHANRNDDLTILQLDAHLDLRDEYQGSKYNHACVMARAKELCPFVQVGIRSMDSAEKPLMNENSVFFARDICGKSNWINKAVSQLRAKVYVTIDLDVLDPSIMPSTGTPEPGGLSWYEALGFLRSVFLAREVVGFDVTELCPNPGNRAPDFLAAKLVYKLLSYKYKVKTG
jgi:agmatinase